MMEMVMNKKLSVVIPTYNEVDEIINTLQAIKNLPCVNEIIVVNDGSTDGTSNVLSGIKGVIRIDHEFNKGYGAAIKTGVQSSTGENICITDADGTYPNEVIPSLFENYISNNLDMVVGSRTGPDVNIPLVRKPAKWIIGKFANWITGQAIPDINSGLRIFKKNSFLKFFEIIPDGFSLTTTITLGMLSGGYHVRFIPINYFSRTGQSKIKPIRDTINFFKIIGKIGLYFSPLRILLPVGIMLIGIGLLWGGLSLIITGEVADLSALIITSTGLQVVILAFISELINHRIPNNYFKNR